MKESLYFFNTKYFDALYIFLEIQNIGMHPPNACDGCEGGAEPP